MTASHLLKLDRALEHAKCLEKEIGVWVQDVHPKAFVRDEGTEPDVYLFRYMGTPDPPDTWGILIGDSLHNLRSALDHLAYALAVAHTGPLTARQAGDSEFPIFGPSALTAGKAKDLIGCIDPQAQAIIKGLQPHLRGQDYAKDPLWLIHDLSRIDKHRLLHTAASGQTGASIEARPNTRIQIYRQNAGIHVVPGTVVAHYRATPFDPSRPMNVGLSLTIGIGFAEGPAKGRYPVRTLVDLHGYLIDNVVGPLEPFL